MNDEGPKPTGAPAVPVELKGRLLPYEDGFPVLVEVPGDDTRYVPCFASEQSLRSFMTRSRLKWTAIKQVQDADALMEDLHAQQVSLMLDPYFTLDGRVRYQVVVGLDA